RGVGGEGVTPCPTQPPHPYPSPPSTGEREGSLLPLALLPSLGVWLRLHHARFQMRGRGQAGAQVFTVHLRDEAHADLLGANRFTFLLVGAVSEPLAIHSLNHLSYADGPLGLSLGQQGEVRNLGGHEQHGRGV